MRPKRPNILVFFTDQQRWDTLGVNGGTPGLTPNLDRVAAANTHAPLAFTPQPVCGPARACLQTGQYASRNGSITNGVPISPDAATLGTHFRSAGYRTGYIGKWHLAPGEVAGPVPEAYRRGYEHWLGANLLEFVSDAYHTVLYDNQDEARELPGYRVDAQTDAAIRFLNEADDRPFFLTLSYLEPHHQNHRDDYPAPEGYAEQYRDWPLPPDLRCLPGHHPPHMPGGSAAKDWPGYCGMIKRLDEAFGRLEDVLRSTGQLDNTVIAVISDHGCHFKTRNNEYKRSCHDASLRIPFILAGPGFRGGGRLDQLVNLLDLPPTLLETAGIDVPPEMQGRFLLPLLRDPDPEWPDDIFAQTSEVEIGRVIRTRRWKYGVTGIDLHPAKAPPPDAVYRETYLYDLHADPYETVNLVRSEAHAPVMDRLRERLRHRMEAAGEPIPEIRPVERHPSGQRSVAPAEIDA